MIGEKADKKMKATFQKKTAHIRVNYNCILFYKPKASGALNIKQKNSK